MSAQDAGESGATGLSVARNEDGIEIGPIERPDPALVARLAGSAAASVGSSAALGREAALAPGAIVPLRASMRTLGPAVTVRLDEIDHFVVLTAASIAAPGDVLVIAAGGGADTGVLGHGLALAAQASGVAGVVVDGAVVNRHELEEMGMPVFCRGASPVTAAWGNAGAINVPVAIGPTTVEPGDVVIGDADGVVVVPKARLSFVVELVEGLEAENRRRQALLAEGEPLLEVVRRARRQAAR